MAPAADMKWSEQAMRESFYMTNICPQNQSLNRGDWNDLEELARDWARKYGSVYIACGPLVSEKYNTIGQNNRIALPNAFYKVFLRQKGSSWTAIGFVMPNQAGSRPLMTYMLSIDEVEQLSGIDFFYNLPDSIENSIEKDFRVRDWNL
jgi:endonuclease G